MRKSGLYLVKSLILFFIHGQVFGGAGTTEQHDLHQFCEFPVQPVGVYPFNKLHQANDVTSYQATGRHVGTEFAPGVHGEQDGSLLFKGNAGSYIELDEGRLDVRRSITILVHVFPMGGAGPIVNYKVDGYGVQLWQMSAMGVAQTAAMMARVNKRNLMYTESLEKQVLRGNQWNYVGLSYSWETGVTILWHDGIPVVRKNVGRHTDIMTQFKVRMGALGVADLGMYYKGRVSCLQVYPEALPQRQITHARTACRPYTPVTSISLGISPTGSERELGENITMVAKNPNGTRFYSYYFNTGDGSPVVTSYEPAITYRYTAYGSYEATVHINSTCTNNLLKAKALIKIQKPVVAIGNMTVSCQPTEYLKASSFHLLIANGSDIKCIWSFGDGKADKMFDHAHGGSFKQDYQYLNPGNYSVVVTCGNRKRNITRTTFAIVQEVISKLEIKPIPVQIYNQSFKIEWTIGTGSQVTYTASIARKGLEVITIDVSSGYTWVRDLIGEGIHDVTVTAFNQITGTVDAISQVRIVRAVAAFAPVVLNVNRFIEVNDSVEVYFTEANTVNGANPIYRVDFGDNSETTEVTTTKVTHRYRQSGTFEVSVHAYNNYTFFNASVSVTVETPVILISGLLLECKATALGNDTVLSISGQGFNVMCMINFGDNTRKNISISILRNRHNGNSSASVLRRYRRTGIFNVELFCWNRLSRAEASTWVTIQEAIKNSRLYSTSSQVYGALLNITCVVSRGTNVTMDVRMNGTLMGAWLNGTTGTVLVPPSVYKTAGKHAYTVRLSNLVSASEVLHGVAIIEYPLRDLRLYVVKSSKHIEVNETVQIDVRLKGSSPLFEFDFGDGTRVLANWTSHALHRYRHPSVFNVSVIAYNAISRVMAFTRIQVEKPVRLLQNMTLVVSPTVLGDNTEIQLTLEQGSDFKCEWDFGDGTVITVNATDNLHTHETKPGGALSSTKVSYCKSHVYKSSGVFIILLRCENRLSVLEESTKAVVQEPISGFSLHPILPQEVGRVFNVTWTIAQGTNVSFQVDIQGGDVIYLTNNGSLWTTSLQARSDGAHCLTIKGDNLVTSLEESVTFYAEHVISGFNVTTMHGLKEIEVERNVTFNVEAPSNIRPLFVFDFGDDVTVTTRLKTVTHMYGLTDAMSAGKPFKRLSVTIHAFNNVSSVNKSLALSVFKPVLELRGLHLISSPANVSMETVITMKISQGSDFNCTIDYGDGEIEFKEYTNLIYLGSGRHDEKFKGLTYQLKHTYGKSGFFDITATCTNRITTAHDVTRITIQEPIRNLRFNKVEPIINGKSFNVSWNHEKGTDVSFQLYLENISIPWYLSNTSAGIVRLGPGEYLRAGQYSIVLDARNLVSRKSISSLVIIQDPVSKINLRVSEDGQNLRGLMSNLFPSEENVTIDVIHDKGTDLSYSWSINGKSFTTDEPKTVVSFSSVGEYCIHVTARNLVSEVKGNMSFTVHQSVRELRLSSNTPRVVNQTAVFFIGTQSMGTQTCFVADMNDGTLYSIGGFHCMSSSEKTFLYREYNSSMSFEHVYSKVGMFNVTVNASNAVSFETSKTKIEIVDVSCGFPEVFILNLGASNATAIDIMRSRPYTVNTDVKVNCKKSSNVLFYWKLMYVEGNGKLHIVRMQVTEKDMTDSGDLGYPSLYIPNRNLSYGWYKVSFTAQMAAPGLDVFQATTEGYLRIISSPLIAIISGGSSIRRGFGRNVTFDGSMSRDEDVPDNEESGLQFTWLCHVRRASLPVYISRMFRLSIRSGLHLSVQSNQTSTGSCYRDGKFILSSSGKTFTLVTSRMVEDEAYEVTLIVTKESRVSHVSQTLEVASGDPPTIAMICVENCKTKLNPSNRLAIQAQCTEGCNGGLTFDWEVYIEDVLANDWKPRDDIAQANSVTNKHGPVFAVPKHAFQSGEIYLVRVYGRRNGGTSGRTEYLFTTNSSPEGGVCFSEPTAGEALITNFKIVCTNWTDSDKPLNYEFSYSESGKEVLLSFGNDSTIFSKLPLGEARNNYSLEISAKIIDFFGAQAHFTFLIQSTEPQIAGKDLSDTLTYMTSGQDSALVKMMDSGNYQSACQLASAVTSVLNRQIDKPASPGVNAAEMVESRKKIREDLVHIITAIPMESLQVVRQAAGAIKGATIRRDETSLSTQKASEKVFKEMTSVLQSSSRGGSGYDTVIDSAESIVGGMGQVLGAAAEQVNVTVKQKRVTTEHTCKSFDFECLEMAEEVRQGIERNASISDGGEQEEINLDTDSKQSRQIANSIFEMLGIVGDAVLNNQLPGEKPSLVRTATIKMAVERSHPETLAGSVIRDGGSASFRLPSNANLFHGGKSCNQAVEKQMMAMEENPFKWDTRASEVKGPVPSLSLSCGGERLEVNNLQEPIDILFPRDQKHAGAMQEFCLKANERGGWNFHRIIVKDNGTAVSVEIGASTQNDLWVFLQRGRAPTESKFITRTEVKRSRVTVKTSVYPTRLFWSDKVVMAGTYYIGVKVDPEVVKEGDLCVNYTLKSYTSKCLYWNETRQQWRSDGCEVGNQTNTRQTHCRCTHLTSFGGAFEVAPNPIDFSAVLKGFSNMFDTGNVAVLFTIMTIFLLYPLLLAWARRADNRDLVQLGPIKLPSTTSDARYRYQITFVTGKQGGSGTTAQVSCTVVGTGKDSGAFVLNDSEERPLFQKRSTNSFILSVPGPIGAITALKIWHDNYGTDPSWYLKQVVVLDCQTDEKWLLLCERWLAVDKEDGEISLVLTPASMDELTTFKALFNSKLTKDITDKHLWFSVLFRPVRSSFTHVQRVSCCLCLLCTAMVTNAMFYGQGPQESANDDSQVKIGPIRFSMTSVVISIYTCLILIPVNLVIVTIFRKVKTKLTINGNNNPTKRSQKPDIFKASDPGGFSHRKFSNNISIVSDSRRTSSDSGIDLGFKNNAVSTEKEPSQLHIKNYRDDVVRRLSGAGKQGEDIDHSSADHVKSRDTTNLTVNSMSTDNKTQEVKNKYHSLPILEGNNEAQTYNVLTSNKVISEEKPGNKSRWTIGPLPHWFVHVAWFLCITSSVTSALFTLFYSMTWGKEKSEEWLLAMVFSFTVDVLISQPIKVVVISVLFALIIKKPHVHEESDEATTDKDPGVEWVKDANDVITEDIREKELQLHREPAKDELQQLRHQKMKEKKLRGYIKMLLFYSLVLALVSVIAQGHISSQSFHFRRSMERNLIEPLNKSSLSTGKMSQVTNVNKFWDYVRQTLLPGLYEQAWYNGEPAGLSGFTASRQSHRVGVTRLRQLRVTKGGCPISKHVHEHFRECNMAYTQDKEDHYNYKPRWAYSTTLKPHERIMGRLSPWHHLTASKANHSLPVIGTFSVYSGGGYIAELGNDKDYAKAYVDYLMRTHWIDKYTRAVFIEGALYNANVNLLTVFDVFVEFGRAGLAIPKVNFKIFSVYTELNSGFVFYSTCELLFVFLMLVITYSLVRRLVRQRLTYFKKFWNWIDLALCATSITCVVLYARQILLIKKAGKLLKQDRSTFLDLYECATTVQNMIYSAALLSFLVVVKLLHSMSFSRSLQLLKGTLSHAGKQVHCFLLMLAILMMAYTSMTFPVLCPYTEGFSTMPETLKSLFSILLGKLDYNNDFVLTSDFQRLVQLFLLCYGVSMIFVFMNFLLSIINNVYADIEDDEEFQKNRFDFFDMVKDKVMDVFGMNKQPEREMPKEKETDFKELHLKRNIQYILNTQVARLNKSLELIIFDDRKEEFQCYKQFAIAKGVRVDAGCDNKGFDDEIFDDEVGSENTQDQASDSVLLMLLNKKKRRLEELDKQGDTTTDERTHLLKVIQCLHELLELTLRGKQDHQSQIVK